MARWQPIIVSGSNISLLNNDAGYITDPGNAFTTASFNGTDLLADSSNGILNFASGSGQGLTIAATAETDTLTFGLSDIPNSSLANSAITIAGVSTSLGGSITADTIANAISADTITNAQLVNDSITVGTTEIALGESATTLVGLISVTSTGFTGSLSETSVLANGVTATTQSPNDNSDKVATTAYVDAQVGGATLNISGSSGNDGIDLNTEALTFAGESGVVTADVAANTVTINLTDGGISNDKLTHDSITIGEHEVALGESVTLDETGFNTGSFTGSFTGDGSGLTGIAATLDISGSTGGGTVDLKTQNLTVAGGSNITTSAVNQTITVALTDSITVTDATITGDLVVQGTASFQHESNLEVRDRFILLASGSSTEGDGGIIVQQATQDVGDVFGFDGTAVTGTNRWGIGQTQNAASSSFSPEAFMSAVVVGGAGENDPNGVDARYAQKGNIFISDEGFVYIYS